MHPTDTSHPDYFHKVVDCQWACPGPHRCSRIHPTDCPGAIHRRLPAEPPVERVPRHPRTRVRSALRAGLPSRPRRGQAGGDLPPEARGRGSQATISTASCPGPRLKNGKRIACIGAGPASLTVANDLVPLGYEVVIFEQYAEPGGLMRSNIPSFRLPQQVLDERDRHDSRHGRRAEAQSRRSTACKQLLQRRRLSMRCSSAPGAPQGQGARASRARGRRGRIHIGITWLESVAFGHIGSIGERVLIIGVGNTAMDCCRTSLRLGPSRQGHGAQAARLLQGLGVGAGGCRRGARRDHRQSRRPRPSSIENGKLTGMLFDQMEYELDGRPDHGRARRRRGVRCPATT